MTAPPPPGHYPGQQPGGYPGYHAPPPGPGYPPPGPSPIAYPGGYAPAQRRRGGGTVARVLAVLAVVMLCAGCAGFLLLKPRWDRYQFEQDFVAYGFQPVGFAPTGDPVYEESPEYVVQNFWSRDELVEDDPEFTDRALEDIYSFARDHGSTAPREDFAACFAEPCYISWQHRDYEMEIAMSPVLDSDFPRWTVSFKVSTT